MFVYIYISYLSYLSYLYKKSLREICTNNGQFFLYIRIFVANVSKVSNEAERGGSCKKK